MLRSAVKTKLKASSIHVSDCGSTGQPAKMNRFRQQCHRMYFWPPVCKTLRDQTDFLCLGALVLDAWWGRARDWFPPHYHWAQIIALANTHARAWSLCFPHWSSCPNLCIVNAMCASGNVKLLRKKKRQVWIDITARQLAPMLSNIAPRWNFAARGTCSSIYSRPGNNHF